MKSQKIILAEDHNVVMLGTIQILNKVKPNAIVTCAWDFPEVLDLLALQEYDLLILDINIPGGDQPNMITSVRKIQPEISILIFSGYDETQYAHPYIKAGANGFLSKTSTEEEFQTAIDRVMEGDIYLSPVIQKQSIDSWLNKKVAVGKGFSELSSREIEVMNLLITGASTSEIGQQLFLAHSTISTHKMNIFKKLNVSNVVELNEVARANQSDE